MSEQLHQLIRHWRRERPDVDLDAAIIVAAIKLVDQRIEAEFRRLSAEFDIGAGDLRVLLALRRSGVDRPLRPTDLFQSLIISSGAVTKQVDRLEDKALVERLPDPDYQRGFRVQLTPRGVEVADAAIEALCSRRTSIGAAVAGLSDQERELGKVFLETLLGKIGAPKEVASSAEAWTAPPAT
ncbi:MAG: MarR family transcriptional regulator [Hyphomicrobiales bacterium]|nr:MarR family transcriptional regulator [Hyphomicrobiales bacterium]